MILSRAPHRTVYGNGRIVGGPYTVTDRTLRTVILLAEEALRYGTVRMTAVYGNTMYTA